MNRKKTNRDFRTGFRLATAKCSECGRETKFTPQAHSPNAQHQCSGACYRKAIERIENKYGERRDAVAGLGDAVDADGRPGIASHGFCGILLLRRMKC